LLRSTTTSFHQLCKRERILATSWDRACCLTCVLSVRIAR
jgi:hypothetical protein